MVLTRTMMEKIRVDEINASIVRHAEEKEAVRFAEYGPKKTASEIKAFMDSDLPTCPCGRNVSDIDIDNWVYERGYCNNPACEWHFTPTSPGRS
jgi:hypothetical protein